MGKGDVRTRRGKIYNGSFGKTRPRTAPKKTPAPSPAPAKR
jgi:30S ribosomal protein S31